MCHKHTSCDIGSTSTPSPRGMAILVSVVPQTLRRQISFSIRFPSLIVRHSILLTPQTDGLETEQVSLLPWCSQQRSPAGARRAPAGLDGSPASSQHSDDRLQEHQQESRREELYLTNSALRVLLSFVNCQQLMTVSKHAWSLASTGDRALLNTLATRAPCGPLPSLAPGVLTNNKSNT